ncbi:hypothetical protein AB836_00645 [Rickettsiales bacterium (ex Bugula neritina AB1)]|nr:hypothetical protein AB836_00645 [Rickettsiales bacterium (ex Bugula neritina AB1)]
MSKKDINRLKKLVEENNEDDIFKKLLLEEKWALGIEKSSIIKGVVVEVNNIKKQVIIDTGLKSYSSINFSEFNSTEIPEKDQQINVFLERISSNGDVIVSYRKVKFEERMKKLEKFFQNKTPIKVKILSKTKMNSFGRNNYIVDLEAGILGVLNNNNYETFNGGDEVSVVIIKYDNNRKFGIVVRKEESEKHVFETKNNSFINDDLNVGKHFELTIKEIKDFGVICEVKDKKTNVLVHVSELFWTKKLKSAAEIEKIYPVGSSKNAILVKNSKQTDSNNRKNIFSIKRCYQNPYQLFQTYLEENKESNTIVEGKIFEIRNNDALLDIVVQVNDKELQLEACVYKSDLDWNKEKSTEMFNELQVGDHIKGVVLNNNRDKKEYDYVNISVKNIKDNNFDKAIENNSIKIGGVYECVIKEYIQSSDIFLVDIIDSKVTGIIKHRDLGELNKIISKNTHKAIGKSVNAKITSIVPSISSIILSVKAIEEDNLHKVINTKDEENTKFGDILNNFHKDE